MLAVTTSMIGAAVLALVALLASIRIPRQHATPKQRLFHDLLKTVTAGGLAMGMVLVAVGVSKVAHFASDTAELAILLACPLLTVMLLRVLQAWSRTEAASHRFQSRA